MEKEFIGYNEALALKELGFDESCIASYTNIDKNIEFCYEKKPTKYSKTFVGKNLHCVAPTYSQAFRFFREKYNLHSTIALISNSDTERRYMVMIDYIYPHKAIMEFEEYETHEEAELECLKKLIEIVKYEKLPTL